MTPAENARQYKRDLRRLMIAVTAAIVGFGALLIAIIVYAGWNANTAGIERQQQLVANALNQAISRTLNDQKSVAWWDDAVSSFGDRRFDTDFADANFGYFLTDTYRHDEVYILNGDGRPVYAFFNGERQSANTFEQRSGDLQPITAEVYGESTPLALRPGVFAQGDYRFLAGGGPGARWSGHIIAVDGRPAIAAAMTIVPNVDVSLARAKPFVLTSITFVDNEFLSPIGQSLLLPDLSIAPTAGGGRVGQDFIGDDGAPLGQLTWTPRLQGDVLLKLILPLVVIGIMLAAAGSFGVLRRLRRASDELADREEASRHQAKHDALSGLPNRAYYLEELDRLLAERTPDGKPLRVAVAYLDIDRFKDLNDTMGHDAGDQLIKSVAERLRAHFPPEFFIARFGGDEFAILHAGGGRREAKVIANCVTAALRAPFAERGGHIRVTASVGIALSNAESDSSGALMRNADIALYEAKGAGRDCAVTFNIAMASAVEMRRMIELDLRNAIENGGLDMSYQAIVSAQTGRITGVEALLRWRHPLCGDIEPKALIPIAEEAGIMPALSEWALKRVFADAPRWPGVEITINLSPTQFRMPMLPGMLRDLAVENAVEPSRVVLEICEDVLLDTTEHTRETLEALQALGFKTSLDDFGTGYSSLVHLCNFKFDKIKIDRSFVVGAVKQEAARAIVNAVVTLGRGLGMDIVAEGVETEVDAMTMRQFGCRELQGFFFSRPSPADEIDAAIRVNAESREAPKAAWLLAPTVKAGNVA